MRTLAVLLMIGGACLSSAARSDEPEWARKAFRPSDENYVYVVGVGIANDELSALREARRHAIASLINEHLSRNSTAKVTTVEGTHGVLLEDRVSSEVYNLDLTQFERIDQRVESRELPIRQFTTKTLYRFPRSLLSKYRMSGAATPMTSSDEDLLTKKIVEARYAEDQREQQRINSEEVYAASYPLLELEFSAGYLNVASYSFFTAGFGLPMRLRLLSDRLVVRPFFQYGFGGSNVTKSEQSNDAESPKYSTAISLGVDVRFYLTQAVDYGLYLVGQAAQDRVTPTCPKTNAGNCVDRAADPFTRMSYSGGFGFLVPSKHPINIEVLYGVPDNRIGVQFHMGIPFLK